MTDQPQTPEQPEREAAGAERPAWAPSMEPGDETADLTPQPPTTPEPPAAPPEPPAMPPEPPIAPPGPPDVPPEPPTTPPGPPGQPDTPAPPAPPPDPLPPEQPLSPEPSMEPAAAPPRAQLAAAPPPPPFGAGAAGDGSPVKNIGGLADERPEVAVGAAFAGGFVVAMILKRLAR